MAIAMLHATVVKMEDQQESILYEYLSKTNVKVLKGKIFIGLKGNSDGALFSRISWAIDK